MSATALAASGELRAQEVPKQPYIVSVAEVAVIRHRGNDFWSRPDLVVQVQRQDRAILNQTYRLKNELYTLRKESAAVGARLRQLDAKKKESEVTPGKPLTDVQLERLAGLVAAEAETCAKLSSGKCRACSPYDETEPCPQCAKCAELRYLKKRKVDSEVVPGEPLTEKESLEVDRLTQRQTKLKNTISDTQKELRRLYAAITGRTPSVETNMKVVNFGNRKLLTVFPGDILEISVWDDDIGDDDLYGKTVVALDRQMLDAGELRVSMPNVQHVQLLFAPRHKEP